MRIPDDVEELVVLADLERSQGSDFPTCPDTESWEQYPGILADGCGSPWGWYLGVDGDGNAYIAYRNWGPSGDGWGDGDGSCDGSGWGDGEEGDTWGNGWGGYRQDGGLGPDDD